MDNWPHLESRPKSVMRRRVFKTDHHRKPKCGKNPKWPMIPRSISIVLLAEPRREKSASTWSEVSALSLTLSASGSPRIAARSVPPQRQSRNEAANSNRNRHRPLVSERFRPRSLRSKLGIHHPQAQSPKPKGANSAAPVRM